MTVICFILCRNALCFDSLYYCPDNLHRPPHTETINNRYNPVHSPCMCILSLETYFVIEAPPKHQPCATPPTLGSGSLYNVSREPNLCYATLCRYSMRSDCVTLPRLQSNRLQGMIADIGETENVENICFDIN